MRLDRLSWPEVRARAAATLLAVPVGSTEQHGRHLPLGTDTRIAQCLCDRLAAVRSEVLVAPPVAYGSAGEHSGFPGTLSIGAAATRDVLVELGRSADAFAGLLFVSTHGGNASPVDVAVRLLRSESRRVRAWSPPPVPRGDAHAGRTETSVMLALVAGDVRMAEAVAGPAEPLSTLMPRLRAEGVVAVSPSGVLGDPAGASAQEGQSTLDLWVADLVSHLSEWAGDGDGAGGPG